MSAALNSILILIASLLAVFWEAAFNGIRHVLGAQVDLLSGLMVYAGLRANLPTVALTATLGGMFVDSLSANPFGVSVLPLFIVGVAIYSQRELILSDQLFAQMVLGLAASALVPVLTILFVLTKSGTPLLGWGSIWQWIVVSVGGAIATPVWFYIFGLFDRAFSYRRASESTSFRPDREIRRGRK